MFEAVVNLGIAFNLGLYLLGPMHLSAIPAATALSNYWGASYLTSLLGGFLSDAFLGNYWTIIVAMLIELVVWITRIRHWNGKGDENGAGTSTFLKLTLG
jgi:peptide/histidine transporter 3/4